jgi:hypothetical protein
MYGDLFGHAQQAVAVYRMMQRYRLKDCPCMLWGIRAHSHPDGFSLFELDEQRDFARELVSQAVASGVWPVHVKVPELLDS